MQLSKAFDPQALIAALKAKGVDDIKKFINDEVPVLLDWANSSVAMEVPAAYAPVLTGILTQIEAKGQEALTALEAKVS